MCYQMIYGIGMDILIRNIDDKMMDRIQRLAEEGHRSRNRQIIILLEAALENEGKPKRRG